MNKRVTRVALCTMLLALSSPVEAQQPAKIPKIGYLGARPAASNTALEQFLREFRKLGYLEGKNIAIEPRYGEDKLDRLPALADELVRLKVDVLLTPSTPVALAAKSATTAIPIVFLNVSDPVAVGLIDSLARPGGNITGITNIVSVLAGKRLELLKESIPKLSRVAVLWNPQDPGSAQQWKESQLPARELGLHLHSIEVSSADKLEGAFREATKAGSGALVVMAGSLASANPKLIADLAAKSRLPTIFDRDDFVASGGLMSYGPRPRRILQARRLDGRQDLEGNQASRPPVEQPTKFELVINLKTAKQIRLTIPPNVLARADKVIK